MDVLLDRMLNPVLLVLYGVPLAALVMLPVVWRERRTAQGDRRVLLSRSIHLKIIALVLAAMMPGALALNSAGEPSTVALAAAPLLLAMLVFAGLMTAMSASMLVYSFVLDARNLAPDHDSAIFLHDEPS